MSRDLQILVSGQFDINNRIQKAQLRATVEVQNAAKDNAPYDTGTLKRTITSDFSKISSGITIVGSPMPYARIRHYINRKNPHTLRYLERGYTENEQRIKDIFIEELSK